MLFKNSIWPIAAALLAVCPGCGSRPGGRGVTVVHRGWPLTLTPHLRSEVVTVSVQSNIFEALVALTPEMELRPLLAEGWECPDELTWVFRLRKGVRFHHGVRMTAEDVVYSLERARRHHASTLRANFTEIDSIAAIGEWAVRITTGRPCPALPNKLTNVFIVPREAMEGLGDRRDSLFSENPIGTGPYRFAGRKVNGPLVLRRWNDYWGAKPQCRQMDIWGRWRLDSAMAMLKAGRADIVTQIDADSAGRLKGGTGQGYRITSRPGLMMRYLGFNCRSRPFEDRRVRRAVALAVDRREVVDSAYSGFALPANQLVSSGVFGFDPGLTSLEYDPQTARRLLREAGHPHGIKASLLLPDARLGLGRLLQKQLSRAGIAVKLQALGREDFFRAVDTADFFLMGASSLSIEAGDLYEDAIHSRGNGYGTTNRGGYSNPRVDSMIEIASRVSDPAERLSILQRVMALAMEDMPRAPLVIAEDIYGVSLWVRWKPRADLMVLGKEISLEEEPAGFIR